MIAHRLWVASAAVCSCLAVPVWSWHTGDTINTAADPLVSVMSPVEQPEEITACVV